MKLHGWVARVFVLGLLCQSALAQETRSLPKPSFAMFDYMKVAADKAEAYADVERSVWRPIHEARLKDGLIRGWHLYRIENPPDQQRDYSFVTINVFDSFAKLENPYPEKYFANVSAADMQKTGESRELIRSEVWRLEESILTALPDDPFIVADYMQSTAGSEAEYYALETEVWKKIHEARMKDGVMNAWILSSRMFPGGTETPYDFMTFNAFPNRESVGNPGQAVQKAIEGMNDRQRDLLNRAAGLRAMVREDTWKQIDQVVPQAEK